MSKFLFVSYNPIKGIPEGHQSKGNVVVFSEAHYPYGPLLFTEEAPERPFTWLPAAKKLFANAAKEAEEIFIYSGTRLIGGTHKLLEDLLKLEKKVHLVVCKCGTSLARELGIRFSVPIIEGECSGTETMARLVKKHAA